MQNRFHILTAGMASAVILALFNGCETDRNRTDYGLELLGSYFDVAGDVSEVALSNDRAWALTSETNSILTFNLSEAAVPTPVGTAVIPDWQQDETFVSATWASDSLLLCTSTRNMKFVKITDSAVPDYFGWDFSGQINHVFPQPGDDALTVFAADRSPEDGIQVHNYDISPNSVFWDFAQASEQSVFTDFDNDINDLILQDGFLYIADGAYGLKVFRLEDTIPLELTEITTLSLAGDARRLVIDENLLVVCAGAGGVYCIDIADPFLPVVLSRYQASYTAYDVELQDDHVFVAWSSSGVLVLDISDPANPQPTYYYNLPAARRIAVNDQVIAVVDGEEGLFFFANPLD
jgi:hypothetical protein